MEPHGGTQVDDWWCLGGALYARFGGSFQAQVNHLQLLRKEQRKLSIVTELSFLSDPRPIIVYPRIGENLLKSSAERYRLSIDS